MARFNNDYDLGLVPAGLLFGLQLLICGIKAKGMRMAYSRFTWDLLEKVCYLFKRCDVSGRYLRGCGSMAAHSLRPISILGYGFHWICLLIMNNGPQAALAVCLSCLMKP